MTEHALAAAVIRPMAAADWGEVSRIFAAGIATGHATFDTEPPDWDGFDRSHLPGLRFVAAGDGGEILGWAAASPVSDRCAYGGVAEDSVYVDPAASGRGLGRALLDHLVAESERIGIWTVQAGVFPENTASIALHERCGFRAVGRRSKLGKLNGVWRDVILLERRSPLVE